MRPEKAPNLALVHLGNNGCPFGVGAELLKEGIERKQRCSELRK